MVGSDNTDFGMPACVTVMVRTSVCDSWKITALERPSKVIESRLMAFQPSMGGRLGGSPQNFYAGRHPSKRFVQGIAAFHQCSILPEVGELMMNNQQYDSHEAECFIVDRSTPCLRGVGVKVSVG